MHDETGLYYWHDENRLVLFLTGRVTANEAFSLYQHIEPWLAEHPGSVLVADMDGTSYIDSTTIGTLIRLHKEMKREGGSFSLCNLSPPVEEIIRKTKLLNYFQVLQDEELRSLEHELFDRMPRRSATDVDSCFVLEAHNDLCQVVPELLPRFERLMAILAAEAGCPGGESPGAARV
ncbi:anti-anti-sigma factor [Alkalispirochaeta americana]|uniref:Anti-sigma factor antagonist n=2 Tax=Alkalispirochaeta americana TaxID=159291 RepID=A0A1N6PQM0_9SPIO|nr:anti-anti-sigma factor [Alkalispirochaeta americana]